MNLINDLLAVTIAASTMPNCQSRIKHVKGHKRSKAEKHKQKIKKSSRRKNRKKK